MMASFSTLSDIDLEKQVAALAGRLRDAMPAIRKQGRVVEKSARDHPAAAAAVGLVVLGLVASLLFSRR